MGISSKWFAVIAATLVASCAGQTIKEKMKDYSGQQVSTLIAKLVRWSRLSEQIFRVDKWNLYQG